VRFRFLVEKRLGPCGGGTLRLQGQGLGTGE
jgi:hypothetical protein